MLHTLLTIVPLFLIIFGAALIQKWKKMDENWSRILNQFALQIGFPALIFSALSKIEFNLGNYSSLILINSGLLLGSFLLTFLIVKLFRLNKTLSRTFFLCLPFANTAYLGIPVLVQIYGETALPTASLVTAVYLFWVFTIGMGILEHTHQSHKGQAFKKTMLSLVKNPLLIAVALGLLVAGAKIPLPKFLSQAIEMLSASATPLVLIVIGLFMGQSKIGRLKEWLPIVGFCFVTLVILPALFYLSIFKLNLKPEFFSASILLAAMPLAITPFALAHHYELDKVFIARSIVLSTMLSIFTIPLWASLA